MAQIVTITNPLTGQPAQVDQLEHTAQEIDDGLNIARGVSNPNLLDNPYFGNPVDQRGGYVVPPGTKYYIYGASTESGTTSAYVTVKKLTDQTAYFDIDGTEYVCAPKFCVRGYTGAGYGPDRWKFDNNSGNATILITDDGIKFVNSSAATGIGAINQKLPPELYSALAGKTVTLSILGKSSKAQQVLFLVNDAVFAVNSSAGGNNARLTTLTATLPQTINNFSIYVYGASEAGAGEGYIKAAKLELGSQQTLAHQENGVWVLNEIQDYGQELAKCQRYLLVLDSVANYPAYVGFGVSHNTTQYRFAVPTPVSMRVNPTVAYSGSVNVKTNSVTTINGMTNGFLLSDNAVNIFCTVESTVAGQFGILELFGGARIILSAEL